MRLGEEQTLPSHVNAVGISLYVHVGRPVTAAECDSCVVDHAALSVDLSHRRRIHGAAGNALLQWNCKGIKLI